MRSPGDTPFADWLIPIFDTWFSKPSVTRIRLFENLLDLILGGHSQTEGSGDGQLNLLTIETDGAIEDVDLMKAAFSGAGAMHDAAGCRATVFTHSFADLSTAPEFLERDRLHSFRGLCSDCRKCPIMRVCGGGILAHRWSKARRFDNPSVYCQDRTKLIRHIENVVGSELQGLVQDGLVEKGLPAPVL